MNSNHLLQKILVPALGVLLLVLGGTAVYFYREVATLKQDPEALVRKEAEELVAVVGKLIILPKDEIPTVATVSDPTKLANQPFFAKAKMGDKVLLYPNAGKAYLYDPVAHKLLEVAPINLGETGPSVDPALSGDASASDTATPVAEPSN